VPAVTDFGSLLQAHSSTPTFIGAVARRLFSKVRDLAERKWPAQGRPFVRRSF
jgi:hypothetical protein